MQLSDEQWFRATRDALCELEPEDVDFLDELIDTAALEPDGRGEQVYELQAGDLQESALAILTFLATHRQALMDGISISGGLLSITSGLTSLWQKLRETRDLGEEEKRVIECLARKLAQVVDKKAPPQP